MMQYKFGACEYNFPMWGSLALEMAHEAGYDGIEITDGGGYLQPHPMNKGLFVECERFTPGLMRSVTYAPPSTQPRSLNTFTTSPVSMP